MVYARRHDIALGAGCAFVILSRRIRFQNERVRISYILVRTKNSEEKRGGKKLQKNGEKNQNMVEQKSKQNRKRVQNNQDNREKVHREEIEKKKAKTEYS